jgi:hypothetical protein
MDEIGVQGNSKPYFVITEKIIWKYPYMF